MVVEFIGFEILRIRYGKLNLDRIEKAHLQYKYRVLDRDGKLTSMYSFYILVSFNVCQP
jgi:hypothetical protein